MSGQEMPQIVVHESDDTEANRSTEKSESSAGTNYLEDARAFLAEHSTATGDGPFTLNPDQLSGLVDPKDAYMLQAIGGPDELAKVLNTNLDTGLVPAQLTETEVKHRTAVYGKNTLPEKKIKSLLSIVWATLNDKVLIILIVAAIISLALGLYETFGEPTQYDAQGRAMPKVDWVEGVAILVAVIIVTIVGSVNDWQKEIKFSQLNRKKDERLIQVVRDGDDVQIPIQGVLAGDIVTVQPGDVLAVDGVLVKGFDVQCDESSATGESDTLRKYPASTVMERLTHEKPSGSSYVPHDKNLDCMMLSGAKVLEGTGAYLVTGVGSNSLFGRTMLSLQDDGTEMTPLQEKLNYIADAIAKFGVAAAVLLFIVLFIRFLVEITHPDDMYLFAYQKGSMFMDIFIVSVTIIVVAVPEGLPLAVTLSLAFATTRMIKDNNLVRVLKSCETMGGATTICSDKTGTLTQNKMTVVAATIGPDQWEEADIIDGVRDVTIPDKKLLLDSVAMNSSVFEDTADLETLIGSKTESALVGFARKFLGLAIGDLRSYRQSVNVVRAVPFDSARKYMLTIIALEKPGTYRMLIKGAAEILLARTSTFWTPDGLVPIEDRKDMLDEQVIAYANNALRPIACAFKDFETNEDLSRIDVQDIDVNDLSFLALFGIMDPLRPGVKEAVAQCQRASVVVRMVTGDNIRTARAIAINAGILDPNDETAVVMEGPTFRNLDSDTLLEIVPRLRVLARSSPQDKRKLVAYLKEHGETVAVTGDGTNDAPALRLADVGFSMGIAGTEVAKEASDIVIMDDNFSSIVNAIRWGRTVNDAVKRFLQFQLTVNITAVVLTFVSAVANKDNKSVLTAVQLLWVNLIMDTLAALALATDSPSDSVLDRTPDDRSKPLITVTMWKMILGQSTFQLCVTLVLHFAGPAIWGVADTFENRDQSTQLAAMVFNAFVWMQFFKLWVSRRVDNNQNIFEGLMRNPFFWIIALVVAGFQVLIMFVGGAAFSIQRQTGAQWGVALVTGLITLPVGFLLRMIPDSFIMRFYPAWLVNGVLKALSLFMAGLAWLFTPVVWLWDRLMDGIKWVFYKVTGKTPSHDDALTAVPSNKADRKKSVEYEWNAGIQKSIDQLTFIRSVHGGRLSRFRFIEPMVMPWTHDSNEDRKFLGIKRLSRPSSTGNLSGSTMYSALMAPVVVSGAIGGWSPTPIDGTKP